MKREEIKKVIEAEMCHETASGRENEFDCVCCCDLMSELLAIMNEKPRHNHGTMLLTGLCNPQVLRTCEMVDIKLVVFLRGKQPTAEMIELAKENGVTVLVSPMSMFKAAGILFGNKMMDIEAAKAL